MKKQFALLVTASLSAWFFVFLFLPPPALSQEEEDVELKIQYRTLQTKYLRLAYYDDAHDYVIRHLARCFENSFRYHRNLFHYTPSEKVTVHLNDFDDFGYAGTTTIPYNYITLGIEPFEYVYDTCPTNERMNWVMSHELVHVAASDLSTKWDRRFRKFFFGKVPPDAQDPVSILYTYMTNPRRYAPRWYHEGIAVYLETWMAGGIGRCLTGWDEMAFRTKVNDSSYFYEPVGLQSEGTAIDFQIGQMAYLYGTRFFSYLSYMYGPEKLMDWVRRDEGSKRYFASQFKNVYGVSLGEEWNKWIEFEHEWQQTNLDSIRQYPITPDVVLSERPLGSVSRQFYDADSRRLFTAVNYPGEFSYIAAIDITTGELEKIIEIPTPALYYVCGLAYDDSTGTLFYSTDNSRGYRDINAVDIETKETRLLFKDSRSGDFVFNRTDRSLWGVRHHGGYTSIARFTPPYNDGREIIVLPYGKDIFDIDISPDGKYLSGTLASISGRQQLILMEIERLLAWDSSYDVIWEFPKNPAQNFVFSPDSRYLYGTSYQTGVSNIFRFEIENPVLEGISNSETGYFRPLPISSDSLIAFRYTSDGFLPIMMEIDPIDDIAAVRLLGNAVIKKNPELEEWELGSPLEVNIDTCIVDTSMYHGMRSMRFTSAYPITEGYKAYGTIGMRFNFMDPLWHNGFDFAVSYSPYEQIPHNERFHARAKYENWRWLIAASLNRADFYDYFGPTKVSRKGVETMIQYKGYPIIDRPRYLEYYIRLGAFAGMERLPEYQNVEVSNPDFLMGQFELDYRNMRRTIGGIEKEKGVRWSLASTNTYINDEIYPLIHGTLDYGFLLPIDHSSIWLRTSAGYSFGDREEPSANFYFGGFGNNWIDHQEVNRYRTYYSFPGVDLNAIGGTTFAKGMLEWTLPPIRFREWGVPSLYFNWMSFAFFTTGIVTNFDFEPGRMEVVDVGGQMNLKIIFFTSLETTFSLGYAGAFMEGMKPQDEFMISLKILK
jgi:hypothetical protein